MEAFQIFFTGFVVVGLILGLYTNKARPALLFLGAALLLLFAGIIDANQLLSGLSNKQIILIFLLIFITSGIQQNIGSGYFFSMFHNQLPVGWFRFRMMVMAAGLSAFINNTPIVAFLIPFVKEWAAKRGFASSQFLLPLSYATIAGGMITVVGTSTNLVLNGLILQSGEPLLGFADFFYLGFLVTILTIVYFVMFGKWVLPSHMEKREEVLGHLQDYIVETIVEEESVLIGKSIQDAGLRNLQEIFLAEIKRGETTLAAVGPEEIIQEGDLLFFAGNTKAILQLMKEKKGLLLPEETHVMQQGFFSMAEAVIPTGSSLIGSSLKDIQFRKKYNASVVSIYRKGEMLTTPMGSLKLQAGDMLLMLTGRQWINSLFSRDLIIVSKAGELPNLQNKWGHWPSAIALLLLIIGIAGWVDLFMVALGALAILGIAGIFSFQSLRDNLDADLLLVLVCSLAVGAGIESSGLADFIVKGLLGFTLPYPPIVMITALFVITVLLTSLITNAAAVSIMFPIAITMGELSGRSAKPFYIAIAFAASACFLTPFGYQTNMMIMGAGNYRFADFIKAGLPLTILYSVVCLLYINKIYI